MDVDYPVDLAILGSYFVFIFGLVGLLGPTIGRAARDSKQGTWTFLVLTAVALASTWTFMLKYFVHSYREIMGDEDASLNSVSHWLHSVSLFVDAWRTVSVGAWQWLWSHQICTFTVAVWTPFLAIEGYRRGIPYLWAYMLLGQVVAISVASGLFFAVLTTTQTKRSTQGAPLSLLACVLVGTITVVLSPFVAEDASFMWNLLAMHAVLLPPLLPRSGQSHRLPIAAIYLLAAGANLAIYSQQWFTCLFTTDAWSLLSTFIAHPAQGSISSDVACVQILCVAWMVQQRSKEGWILALLTPFLSASVTFPVYQALVELAQEHTKSK